MKKLTEKSSLEKKRLMLIVVGIFLILAGFTAGVVSFMLPSKENSQDSSETTDVGNENIETDANEYGEYTTVLWTGEEVHLRAVNPDTIRGGENEPLMLVCGENKIYFEGSFMFHVGTRTDYYKYDVTNDGVRDHIITLPTNSGTGVKGEEIHVFDGKTLREIGVEDSLDYLNTVISFTADDEYYYVSSKKYSDKYKKDLFQYNGTNLQLEVPLLDCGWFDYIITEAEDKTAYITARHPVAVADGLFDLLGDCIVSYLYTDEGFICDDYDYSTSGFCQVQNSDWDMRCHTSTSSILFTDGESRFVFCDNNILMNDGDKLPYAYIFDDEEYAIIVYYDENEVGEAFHVKKAEYIYFGNRNAFYEMDLTFDEYLTHHGVDKAEISEYLTKGEPRLSHTMEVFCENSEIYIRSKIESIDGKVRLWGRWFRNRTTYDYEYYVDKTVVGNTVEQRDVLEELCELYGTDPLFAETATAFIKKDTKSLEELLGCREGVLSQYADFEFGDYSFESGKDSLSMTVKIKKSSLPDVPAGDYTVTFTYGRFAKVSIRGLGVDSKQFTDEERTMCENYIHNWVGLTGMWDYSTVLEINEKNDNSFQHKNLVAYLECYGKLKTVEDFRKAALDIFGIEELNIPEDFIADDGTVSVLWGHGGSVRSYRITEIVTDETAKLHTVYVQTYADFGGTVRSHLYEYKFEDHGTYLKVISSGICEKGEFEPEDRYFC